MEENSCNNCFFIRKDQKKYIDYDKGVFVYGCDYRKQTDSCTNPVTKIEELGICSGFKTMDQAQQEFKFEEE